MIPILPLPRRWPRRPPRRGRDAPSAAACGAPPFAAAFPACPRLRRPGQPGGGTASVIHPYQERPKRGVPDHAQRAWIHLNALAQIQVQAEAVRNDRFNHPRASRSGKPRPCRAGRSTPGRVDRAVLHLGHGLRVFPGEAHRAGMGLHHTPQRILGQPLERLARPVPVLDLGELLVLLDRGRGAVPRGGDRLRGFPAAVERAVMIASRGTSASRAASAPACARPRSSSGIPGVRPVRTFPVPAVSPCRTSKTNVTP